MSQQSDEPIPDDTAIRTALWRALHLIADAPPPVFNDPIGLELVAPDDGWQTRPDMGEFTRPFRAAIVARSRFVEDLVAEEIAHGITQYVILGAGLDSFAQRRVDLAARTIVFEVDQPGPQAWKQKRLAELGLNTPRFVPVNFESGDSWWEKLSESGFDNGQPAIVASTGVSMYLTKEAIFATLCQVAKLAPGSVFLMSFLLPLENMPQEVQIAMNRAVEGAKANGTPFLSFFNPTELLSLANDAGFRDVRHVSAAMLANRYFHDRTDGLRPPDNSEEFLVART